MGLPTRAPAPRRGPRQGLLSPPLWTGPQRTQGPTPVTAASAPSEGPPSAQGRAGSPPLTPGHTQAHKLPGKGRARAAPDPGQSRLADSACAPTPAGGPPEQRKHHRTVLAGAAGFEELGGHRPGLGATGPSLPVDRTGGQSQGTARRTGSAAPRTPASGTGRAGRQPEPQLEPALSESKQPPSRPGPAALPPPALPEQRPQRAHPREPPHPDSWGFGRRCDCHGSIFSLGNTSPHCSTWSGVQAAQPEADRGHGQEMGGGRGGRFPAAPGAAPQLPPPGPPPGSHGEGQARICGGWGGGSPCRG
ncbi:hypothetical protein VULLAG_LOCUS5150 [Vulpes lagopus]